MVLWGWEQRRKLKAWTTVPAQRQAKESLHHSKRWRKEACTLSQQTRAENYDWHPNRTLHCPVKYHLRNIGKATEDSCHFCNEATESAKHLLCECEAVRHQRLSHLGSRLLDPEQVMDIAPRKVAKFMKTLLPDWQTKRGRTIDLKVKVHARLQNQPYAPPITYYLTSGILTHSQILKLSVIPLNNVVFKLYRYDTIGYLSWKSSSISCRSVLICLTDATALPNIGAGLEFSMWIISLSIAMYVSNAAVGFLESTAKSML